MPKNARKDHNGMHRVQAEKLRHKEKQRSSQGEDGDQEVLQILQKAHTSQGNKIILFSVSIFKEWTKMAENTKKSGKIATYFRELKSEFKRISWPSFKQVKNNTGIVIAFIVVLGIFIAIVDFIFNWLISLL